MENKITETLIQTSKNFFSLKEKDYLSKILQNQTNYSIFCLFKSYDNERLYNLAMQTLKNLGQPNISEKDKTENENFLAIVLGAFEEKQKESEIDLR